MMTITGHRRGEITFGALQAGLEIEYSRSSIGFTWEGFDEMDEVSGDGSAELLDDGSIEIEFAYHNGDEAILKAMGRLVQQSPAAGTHRQHPAGRSRGALLRHAGSTSYGGVTQTKQPPENPGRFI